MPPKIEDEELIILDDSDIADPETAFAKAKEANGVEKGAKSE